MQEEIGKLYIELPGAEVGGTAAQKNLVMLHEHRDVFIKLEGYGASLFKIVSHKKQFYVQKCKKLLSKYEFASGEEIHLWLSKFHDTQLEIQRQTKDGWVHYGLIDPPALDGADYSPLAARPAPIILKVGPYGSPMGSTLPATTKNASIPGEYREKLTQLHTQTGEPKSDADALLKKWETHKFPSLMTREEGMRSCHAYPQDPEVAWHLEVLPSTRLYAVLPREDSTIPAQGESGGLLWLIADAMVAALGEVADKHRLVQDLRGVSFKITTQIMKDGTVKKFIVFKGFSGTRLFIDAVKYGVANVKVATLTAQHQTFSQLASSSAGGVKNAFGTKAGGALAILALAIDTVEWIAQGGEEVERLFAKWSTTLIGIAVTAGLAPFVATVVGILLSAAGVTAALSIAIVVGASIVVIGIVVGIILALIGVEEFFYDIYKNLRSAWKLDTACIGYDDFIYD